MPTKDKTPTLKIASITVTLTSDGTDLTFDESDADELGFVMTDSNMLIITNESITAEDSSLAVPGKIIYAFSPMAWSTIVPEYVEVEG